MWPSMPRFAASGWAWRSWRARWQGFVRVGPPVDGAPVGLIYLLYVRPEHWGKGCGKALMDWGLGQLSAMGMSEAILWVLEDNVRARTFYEASGWRAEGETSVETFGAARLASLRYRRAALVPSLFQQPAEHEQRRRAPRQLGCDEGRG